ncbi:reverse transcriptase family protein [Brumimicrobium mesophilum]|uniref:reverse transcriptase family protein n=1 Tax=Brumimicrobium mesophilum TaxID=392717 RepID=UPI000D13F53B|nr:reverse transcriptase family protein [Brumimicrobium mesophilum]
MEFPLNEFIELAKTKDKSQEYINSVIHYVKNLESNDFPIIFTRQHWASMMQIQSTFIDYLLNDYGEDFEDVLQSKYSCFTLRKRNGGERLIMAPKEDLKYLQKWIQFNILNNYKFEDSCTGFIIGKSIKDNAKKHEFAETILKIDLLQFFDTIKVERIYYCFKKMGYIGNVSHDFANLCTVVHPKEYWKKVDSEVKSVIGQTINSSSRVLPQGAPTSPLLANIVASKMDKRFGGLSKKLGFNYTRYADDLTFSIKKGQKLPSLNVIYQIIESEGFYVNKKKTKFINKGCAQYVTGLTIANGVNVNKKYRKMIERHLYFCRKYGVDNHLNKNKKTLFGFNRLSFHDWLYGHICYIKSINENCYKKLIEEYKKITWTI